MKKLTTLLLMLMTGISILGFSACDPEAAMMRSETGFTYVNNSSTSITIIIKSNRASTNQKKEETLLLMPLERKTLFFRPYNYKYPLCLIEDNPSSCVNTLEIFNSDKILLLEQSYPDGSLYNINTYTELNPDDPFSNTEYEFTFTDEFFESAK